MFSALLGVLACTYAVHIVTATTNTEYPLYAIFDGKTKLSTSDLELIAESFHAAQAQVNSSAAKIIHNKNPDMKLMHYTDDEAIVNLTDAEYNKTNPLRYSFGTLSSSLTNSASDKTVNVRLYSDFKQIPFKKSTTSSAYSSDCTHFISWIRIDDEYMKVTGINGDKLTVDRGFNGNANSKPVLSSHSENAVILAPVFFGAAPGTSSCDKTYEYLLNPESEYAMTHYAEMTHNDIMSGLDGSWYDNWGATAPFPIDGLGNSLKQSSIWDDLNKDYYTDCNAFRMAEQNRLTGIYNYISSKYKLKPQSVTIWANNMASGPYDKCHTYDFLIANPPSFPYPLKGYCMEGYALHQSGSCQHSEIAWSDLDKWTSNVNELINVTSMGIRGMPMLQQAGCKAKGIGQLSNALYQQVMTFGYVTYLMGVDSRNSSSYFGIYGLKEENNQLRAYIDDVFFYKIGDPTERKTNVDEYKISGHISYQRSFENGIVVVNPNNKTDNGIELSKTYINPQTNKTVKSLNAVAHTAYILLNQ